MSDACIIHLENYWKKLISEANESFSNKDYTSALHRYEEALFRGEVLNNYIDDCIRDRSSFYSDLSDFML